MSRHLPRSRHDIERIREDIRKHPKGANRSANEIFQEQRTRGERMSDTITTVIGSWKFILIQAGSLVIWLVVNSIAWFMRWDPYPFILLNLVLSFQAAFTAPIIMMSQNRQTTRDRVANELDFAVNRTAAAEVDDIQARLDELQTRQWESLLSSLAEHRVLLQELHTRTAEIERLVQSTRNPDNPV